MTVLLKTEKLYKTFGALVVTHYIDFEIKEGEKHAIIGPNGAGKTTFFNLLGGELLPTSGAIFFRNKEITELPQYKRALAGIGRTFQKNNLFLNYTPAKNIIFALQAKTNLNSNFYFRLSRYKKLEEEACKILTQVNLIEDKDTVTKKLSYGKQRQLEIAIALASKPSLLLLDEPTAGMSPAETNEMMNLIGSLPSSITIIIIEHDMEVVFSVADRITVLYYGEVIAEGSKEEIQANRKVQEVYLGLISKEV